MALVRIEKQLISDIADAVREKVNIMSNTEVPFTKETYPMTPEQIADVIGTLPVKGKPEMIPEEALKLSGSCDALFANGNWDWFIEQYGYAITTESINRAKQMFYYSQVEEIPFDINFTTGSSSHIADEMFYCCYSLKEIGTIRNFRPQTIGNLFASCNHLRYLPTFENLDTSRFNTEPYTATKVFDSCYSLRSIPEDFLKQFYNSSNYSGSSHFNSMFNKCYALDEIKGLSFNVDKTFTSNMFQNTFNACYRLKDLVFKVQEDGTPYVASWKGQTIDLTNVGDCNFGGSSLINYNSGITSDKAVSDDASYQALKNDPDWFAYDAPYARYNHDSAVNTINSLPDTSAYLASNGGTNTIKFLGTAGSKTDGGAINTLTEAEIAVATAKGWTVTFV